MWGHLQPFLERFFNRWRNDGIFVPEYFWFLEQTAVHALQLLELRGQVGNADFEALLGAIRSILSLLAEGCWEAFHTTHPVRVILSVAVFRVYAANPRIGADGESQGCLRSLLPPPDRPEDVFELPKQQSFEQLVDTLITIDARGVRLSQFDESSSTLDIQVGFAGFRDP